MKNSLFVLLASVLVFMACSSTGKIEPEKPLQQLLRDGVSAYDRGDYKDALENFEQLKNWYTYSRFAKLAELKIADANYHLQQYPEAISAYEDFERLHPLNEAVPYVIYQIGRCYYEQMDSIDRDQTSAQKALDTFQRLVNQYPQDPYSRASQPHIITCLQHLCRHDLYIAKFYLRAKRYDAALARFVSIVEKYPDVGLQHEALSYIAKCRAYIPGQSESSDQPDQQSAAGR